MNNGVASFDSLDERVVYLSNDLGLCVFVSEMEA